jgi:hypothetical protein
MLENINIKKSSSTTQVFLQKALASSETDDPIDEMSHTPVS